MANLELEELTDDEDFLNVVNIIRHPRAPQVYRPRTNHFTKWNDTEFKQRFRLSKGVGSDIINLISDDIASNSEKNHALSPSDMVFLTLRYLGTGPFLQVSNDLGGVDKSATSRAIEKVLYAIAALRSRFIKMPNTEAERDIVQQGFYTISRFPRCIGAIDCTHVRILSPGGDDAENYRNLARWPGASHDSHIFRSSTIKARFENGEFGHCILVGDSGYGLKSYLVTPLANPQTRAESLFNESQIRTRNPIERCFGILKRRFPILAYGIRLKMNKVEAVVMAAAILHNIANSRQDDVPIINEGDVAAINFVNNVNIIGDANDNNNRTVRNDVIQYFHGML